MLRIWVVVLALLAVMVPSLGYAEVTACDLVTKADVERITGLEVAEPELQDLSFCGGLCESTEGTGCIYKTLKGKGVVAIEMNLPPFGWGDWLSIERAVSRQTGYTPIDMKVFASPALWSFDPNRSILHVFEDPLMHISIVQDGVDTNEAALKKAEAMAALVHNGYKPN